MSSFKPVTHCIFDMDGLLLDTEKVYEEVIQKICAEFGKTFTWEIKQKQMGMLGREAAELVIEALKLPLSVEEYFYKTQEFYKELMPQCQLLPGADRLVRHLHKNGVPIAVATSSGSDSVQLKTTHHQEFLKLFHHVVAGGTDPEVKNGKPAPDIFLVCASRFDDKPDPSSCLVFEDAPNGVKAARAASMQVVMVPESRVGGDMKKDATLVLSSLEDFKPELFGLPAF